MFPFMSVCAECADLHMVDTFCRCIMPPFDRVLHIYFGFDDDRVAFKIGFYIWLKLAVAICECIKYCN